MQCDFGLEPKGGSDMKTGLERWLIEEFECDRMNRRRLMKMLGAVGLGLATTPLSMRGAHAAGGLTILSWSGYDIPDMAPSYYDKHDSPEFTLMGSDEEGFQKVRAGFRPDLGHHTSFIVGKYKDAGLLKPIDPSRLVHLGDYFPELPEIVTIDGKLWEAPLSWGNSSVIYRRDMVDVKEESWGLLWDERYAGRLAGRDALEGMLIVGGLYTQAADPWTMTDAELQATKEALVAQKPLLRFYWSSQTDLEQAFANGEIVAGYGWNASVAMLRKQGVDMALMKCKEGIVTWTDGLVMMDGGSGDEALAYDFMNAYMSPEVGAFLINSYGYGSGNAKAYDSVTEERLAELGITDPDVVISTSKFQREIDPAIRPKYQEVYDEVKLS